MRTKGKSRQWFDRELNYIKMDPANRRENVSPNTECYEIDNFIYYMYHSENGYDDSIEIVNKNNGETLIKYVIY